MSLGSLSSQMDYESDYVLQTLRRWADAIESHYPLITGLPKAYMAGLARSIGSALQCSSVVFAGGPDGKSAGGITIIHASIENEWEKEDKRAQLAERFTKAIDTPDEVFGCDVTCEDEPYLCRAKHVRLPIDQNTVLSYDLLIEVSGRSEPPDPAFPLAKFRTYDKLFLQGMFAHFALYVKHEHSARREWLNEACKGLPDERGDSEVRPAAEKVLDFESLVGLPTDPDVFARWLDAEKRAFLGGTKRMADFEKSLKKAKKWLKGVKGTASESLRRLLFECHLARLTKKRDIPLLSQRIARAEKLAGIRATAGA